MAIPNAPSGPTAPASGWRIVMADDFDGTTLSNLWTPDRYGTLNTLEDPFNTWEKADFKSTQVSLDNNSHLALTCAQTPGVVTSQGTRNFTSGTVFSAPVGPAATNGFLYQRSTCGRICIEAVLKVPANDPSLFPAFWAVSYQSGSGQVGVWVGEQDYFEIQRSSSAIDSDWIYDPSGRFPSPHNYQDYYNTTLGFDAGAAYHRYTIDMFTDGSWQFYIDGTLQTWVNGGTAPAQQPYALDWACWYGVVFNYSLSSVEPSWAGGKTSDQYLVDSVAVYQDKAITAGSGIKGGGIFGSTGGGGGALAPSLIPGNLLTLNEQDVETDATGWSGLTNTTVAQSATANTGNHSVSLASQTTTADLSAYSTPGFSVASGVISAGKSYALTAYCKAVTVARSCTLSFDWYVNDATYLSTSSVAAVTDTTSGWTKISGTLTAPATATAGNMLLEVTAPAAGGETHLFDTISFIPVVGATQAVTLVSSPSGGVVPAPPSLSTRSTPPPINSATRLVAAAVGNLVTAALNFDPLSNNALSIEVGSEIVDPMWLTVKNSAGTVYLNLPVSGTLAEATTFIFGQGAMLDVTSAEADGLIWAIARQPLATTQRPVWQS